MIRVLLADDQRLVRSGFRMILRADPELDVVGEAGDGVEAVELAGALAPDVVLMDVRMPRLDGIEATRRITAAPDPPRVLVLTTFDLDEYVYGALRAGASGFLLKDAPEEQLAAAIRVAADGGRALLAGRHPAAHRAVRGVRRRRPAAGPRGADLTRGRGPAPRRAGPIERGDRRRAGRERAHGEDARRQHPRQAGPPRPDAGGRRRLRVGARPPGGGGVAARPPGATPRRRARRTRRAQAQCSGQVAASSIR